MNLLENYIDIIHHVQRCEEEWTKEFPDKKFVSVNVTTNCYGSKSRQTHVWTEEEWEKIQQQGYFMG